MDEGDMTVLHNAVSSGSVGGAKLLLRPEEDDEGPGISTSRSPGGRWVSAFSLALHLSWSAVFVPA